MKRLLVLITLFSFLFSVQIGYSAPLTSTLKDQQSVAVTIYNSNVGLVKDTRLIDLKPGVHKLKFPGPLTRFEVPVAKEVKVKYRIRFKY
jgi:hypothetical protein